MGIRNRVRGAVLIFALGRGGKSFFKEMANIRRSLGLLEPGLNISKSLRGEPFLGEQNAGFEVSGSFKTIPREEVRKNILLAGKILNHKVCLGKRFPPAAEAPVMGF